MIRPLAEVEREAIVAAVLEAGCTLAAAKALGIGSSTLYRKLAEYEIKPTTLVQPSKYVET